MMESSAASLLAQLLPDSHHPLLYTHDWPSTLGKPLFHHGHPAQLPSTLRDPNLQDFDRLAQHYRGEVWFTRGKQCYKMIHADQTKPWLLRDMGLTVYFHDIVHCLTDGAGFVAQLEQELGVNPGAVRLAVFASPQGDGVSCHYDAQDVFCIQLRGEKRFHVAPVNELSQPIGRQYASGSRPFDDLYPQTNAGFPDIDSAEFETVHMRPGSVLFMPRGIWHSTDADSDSLSVSIIVNPPTVMDAVLEQMRLLMLQDPRWRAPLYGRFAEDARRQRAIDTHHSLMATLGELTAQLDVERLDLPLLNELDRLQRLSLQSQFRVNPHTDLHMASDDKGVSIQISSEDDDQRRHDTCRMQVSREAAGIFNWIRDHGATFTLADLVAGYPAFAETEHRQVVTALVRADYLKQLWYPQQSQSVPMTSSKQPGLDRHVQ